MNVLDIDPQNLKFDFGRDWDAFQTGKVKVFLVLYLRLRVEAWRTQLEVCQTLEEIQEAQGALKDLRHLLVILEAPKVNDQVNQILEFLKTHYGR